MIVEDKALKLLYLSIIALSASNEDQINFTKPGCIYCDLINDFDNCLNNWVSGYQFSDIKKNALNNIEKAVESFIEQKYPCYDAIYQNTLEWENIRTKSKEAMLVFKIKNIKLPVSIKNENDVWKTDITECLIEVRD